jgi:hypothetical protein
MLNESVIISFFQSSVARYLTSFVSRFLACHIIKLWQHFVILYSENDTHIIFNYLLGNNCKSVKVQWCGTMMFLRPCDIPLQQQYEKNGTLVWREHSSVAQGWMDCSTACEIVVKVKYPFMGWIAWNRVMEKIIVAKFVKKTVDVFVNSQFNPPTLLP